MATLSIPDRDFVTTDVDQIKTYLSGIGIDYDVWPLVKVAPDADGEAVLQAYADKIDEAKEKGHYTSVDVINVNSLTAGIDEMLAKFNREHWHDEDEVRFTIAGRGLFHIHPAKGPVVAIEVGAGDMIRVPKGTHHWFNLCGTKEIKTIRFFQDKSGWTPHYTGTKAAENYEPVCFGPHYVPHARS